MSFGPTSQEKSAEGQVGASAQAQSALGGQAAGQGSKLFNQAEKALKGPLNYWSSILSGNPTAVASAVAPTTNAISQQYNNAELAQQALTPGTVSGQDTQTLETQKAGAISNAIMQAPQQAASSLASLTGTLLGGSTAETGLGLQGYSGSAASNLGLLQQEQQFQQMTEQLFGSIGQGLGGIAGAALGGLNIGPSGVSFGNGG
jgi:hypothetical protein